MLPMPRENAREAAHQPFVGAGAVASAVATFNSGFTACGQTRAPARNSIFRYPSPCGCSDSLSFRTPVFLRSVQSKPLDRQSSAHPEGCGAFGFPLGGKTGLMGQKNSLSREQTTCKNSNSLFWAPAPRACLRPVGTTWQSKPCLAGRQVPLQPKRWVEASRQACLSVPLATSFSAKKTRASADTLNSSTAASQSEATTKATRASSARVAFSYPQPSV